MSHLPAVGEKAPAFDLPDQHGKQHKLSDYLGKWLLVYFYPKDMTPGCTQEACAIRDAWSEFGALNAAVVGVSADSTERHKKFQEKYSLPFPLLADETKSVIASYSAWGKKKFMGRSFMGIRRMSVLVDPRGRIVKIYDTVKPAIHAQEVLADIRSMQQ